MININLASKKKEANRCINRNLPLLPILEIRLPMTINMALKRSTMEILKNLQEMPHTMSKRDLNTKRSPAMLDKRNLAVEEEATLITARLAALIRLAEQISSSIPRSPRGTK